MKHQEVARTTFFLLFSSQALSLETTIYTKRQKSFIYFTLTKFVYGSTWRKIWTHVFLYFFFVFNGIVLRKNNKKMIEPTLIGGNSFGEFDGAQFARRLFPGVVFHDSSRYFPWPNVRFDKLLQHVCKTTEYFLVVSNKECHQFLPKADHPYKDTKVPQKCYTVFKFIVIISCLFLLLQKVYTLPITSWTLHIYP